MFRVRYGYVSKNEMDQMMGLNDPTRPMDKEEDKQKVVVKRETKRTVSSTEARTQYSSTIIITIDDEEEEETTIEKREMPSTGVEELGEGLYMDGNCVVGKIIDFD